MSDIMRRMLYARELRKLKCKSMKPTARTRALRNLARRWAG
jgi:hypothetical protein